jgi:membrane protease YdiL (CAAX protease family)
MNVSTSDQTIFSLLSTRRNAPDDYRWLWSIFGLLITTWLGINAIWSLTSPKDTLISSWLRVLMSLENWVVGTMALLVGAAVLNIVRKQKVKQGVVGMLLAYCAGVFVSRYAYVAVNPTGGVPLQTFADVIYYFWQRSFFLMPAIPMLVVYLLLKKRDDWHFFRWGDWKVATRVFAPDEEKQTWRKQLFRWLLFAALPLAVLMQLMVGLAPILTGKLFLFFVPIISMAFFNAFSEELIFRGFMQQALIDSIGPGSGIWLQGLFFGIHHWGTSPGGNIVMGLPIAMITAFWGIVWGKSVFETKGLGWAICCHMFVDAAFFSAQYVATT